MKFIGLKCEYPECDREVRWFLYEEPPKEAEWWSIYKQWSPTRETEKSDAEDMPLCPEHGQRVARLAFGFKAIEDEELDEWWKSAI